MNSVLTAEQSVTIGYDQIDIWPSLCPDGHKCIRCYLVGKIRCAPRFWCTAPPVPQDDTTEERRAWWRASKEDTYGHKAHKEQAIELREQEMTSPEIADSIQSHFGVAVHQRTILKWVSDIPYSDKRKHQGTDNSGARQRAVELRRRYYMLEDIRRAIEREYGETFTVSTIYRWVKDILPVKRVYCSSAVPND